MDTEFRLGLTEEDMRVNSNQITNKAKEDSHGQTVDGMMAIGIVARSMVMDPCMILKVVLRSKVSG